MGYFGDYQRKPIEAGYVDQEGDYQVKIMGYQEGQTKEGARYVQVKCLVNYKTRPSISIFLTEGPKFDGNFTAFCDTFGINPNEDPNNWINKTGWIHIMLTKKDGFTNMVQRWILNDDGFIKEEVKRAAGNSSRPVQAQQPAPQQSYGDCSDQDFGDIPF